jgi:tRNA A-37 threonylcarbamoyl transferase component Bud32
VVNPTSSSPASAPTTGTVLAGRYELVRFIARGGMAEVYEATDRVLDRRVAVKLFRAAEAVDRQRFDAEVLLLASLSHPGLVAVYDAGEHGGDGFVVLELVEGPTLAACLAERGALPPAEVASLGERLADALDHVHERGIVHRDLTPSNVLCAPDGQPRLTDFGIARLLDTARVTAPSTTVGTAAYMAPEQLEGHDVIPAADVYALGLVLLEALVGEPPFSGQPHEAAMARLVRDPEIPTSLPAPWSDLLRAMTARSASDRPSARDVADRLRNLEEPTEPARPPVVVPAPDGAVTDPALATTTLPVTTGTDLHAETVPVPVVAASPPAGSVPPRGGTTVMPAAMAPAAPPPPTRRAWHRGRPAMWLALGLAALLAVLALSSGSDGWTGDAIDARTASTTTQPPAEPVVTTAAPTTTTTAAPVAPAPKPPKGKGKGKKH